LSDKHLHYYAAIIKVKVLSEQQTSPTSTTTTTFLAFTTGTSGACNPYIRYKNMQNTIDNLITIIAENTELKI
jgi:hypothetical protein